MQIPAHDAIVAFAREHDLVCLIDATFATPVNFKPIPFGYDLVLHSCTKYLNGHSDIVAGAVVGSSERVAAVAQRLKHFGGSLDPHACFLLERGLKTLVLRVERQSSNSHRLADFLASRPEVSAVHYPALEGHPDHARTRWFRGCGGLLAFELAGGASAAERFLGAVRLAIPAPSLGGVETLVTRPALTSHSAMDPEERRRAGITDGLVRVAVGIEHVDDLLADFETALEAAGAAARVTA